METAFSRILSVIRLLAYKLYLRLLAWLKQIITQCHKGGERMTQNQIAYWRNVELERANRATEQISAAAQRSKEQLEAEQAKTEGAKREELGASTGLKSAQTTSAEADAALKGAQKTKTLHDVVTNYMEAVPGELVTKAAVGAIASKALGVDNIVDGAIKGMAKDVVDIFSNSANNIKAGTTPHNPTTGSGKGSGSTFHGGGDGTQGGGFGGRR